MLSEVKCDNCKKIFKTQRSWLKNYKHHYCSKDCKNKHHSILYGSNLVGKNYHKEHYQKNRNLYLERGKARYLKNKEAKHEYDRIRRDLKGDELRAYDLKRSDNRRNSDNNILHRAKSRSRLYGMDFNITIEDIKVPEFCPILGIKLFTKKGHGGGDNSPSIDRIDPSKGYVKGNVVIISNRANRIKNDATYEEALKLVKWWENIINMEDTK